MTLLLFSMFVALFLLRVPIAIALGMSTLVVLMMDPNFTLYMVPQRMFAALDTTPLMAIPGFVLAGVLLSRGGVSRYLIEGIRSYVGHMRGGLAVVTILACMIFAAISGSSPATAAAIGSIMIPGMVKAGYDKKYAMGLVAAAGTLGILIPPSIPLIIYGIVSEESIGKLFMAGVLPGLLLGGVLIVSAIIYARKNNYGGDERYSWSERIQATKKAVWGAFLPFLILGSIYTGVCTPTESAVIAVFYTIFVSSFIYKELSWKDIRPVFRETINITSMIFLIISGAMLFALYLTNQQVPQDVASWIGEHSVNKWLFFLATNLMFFVMGTFLEAVSIILITLPILLPLMKQMGIDPIHFAIVMTVNMELAMITPPVGLNLFVVSGISKESLVEVVKGVLPFIVLMILCLILFVVWPDISLYLPNQMN